MADRLRMPGSAVLGSLVLDPNGALLILGPILCCAGTVMLWITWGEYQDYRDRYSSSKRR